MSTERPTRRRSTLYGWALFLLVVGVATWFVGPVALIVFALVVGVALIVTGARSAGWPRPALIVLGCLVLAGAVLFIVDVVTGYGVVSVY